MIFVTVGTHEQQFNRLVECIDRLKCDGRIDEDVFIQTGYCTYEPKYCKWERMIPYSDMDRLIKEAHIVITHAGPSSFIPVIREGKIPIVVPRAKKYNEHVNDHQVFFSRAVSERMNNIILTEDVTKLGDILDNYDALAGEMIPKIHSNNEKFVADFEKIVNELVNK